MSAEESDRGGRVSSSAGRATARHAEPPRRIHLRAARRTAPRAKVLAAMRTVVGVASLWKRAAAETAAGRDIDGGQ